MAIVKIPPLWVDNPAFLQENLQWINRGASAIWTDNEGIEHHVIVIWRCSIPPDTTAIPEVSIRYQSRIDLHPAGLDPWIVPAASLKKDVLAEILSLIPGKCDDQGYQLVKLSEQDLNGLEAIIRFARNERTAGALDRIVVIAESILRRYRQEDKSEEKS